jgi:predicted RND superfamily exporter protein
VPRLQTDPSLKSVLVTTSSAYYEYERFLKYFKDEEFIVVAMRNERGIENQEFLESVSRISGSLAELTHVAEVLSLTTLKSFGKKGGKVGSFPVVGKEGARLVPPTQTEIAELRKAMPLMDLIASKDMKTAGILVRLGDEWKFDVDAINAVTDAIRRVVDSDAPRGTETRVIGMPILRSAILKYSLQTAFIFGALCMIICTAVTIYIFKSVKVTATAILILGLCVLWVLGLMSMLKTPLNASTSISFGLILIVSLEIVIHTVARFNQFREGAPDREQAMKETLRYLGRPFLISAVTTAVGFGSCMVTSIPMVFELGRLMSISIILTFCLAFVLTPFILIKARGLDLTVRDEGAQDLFGRALGRLAVTISNRYRLITIAGFTITVFFFAGAPLIKTDPQILRQLGDSRQEIKAIAFVENNLTSIHTLQIFLEAEPGAFKTADAWKRIDALDRAVGALPEVISVDSLLPFLQRMSAVLSGVQSAQAEVFSNPKTLRELLLMLTFTPDGKRLLAEHTTKDFDKFRITVRFKNSKDTPILKTIEEVRQAAASAMGDLAKVTVTGESVVVAAQGDELVESQIWSMFIAVGVITVLMMIQMGTPLFGLISLIPNVPPVAAVFGVMGYLGIPLDGVTVFAATVAIGLAVDNTIQFVNQLKREIRLNPSADVEECVFTAYASASKPMASWSIVTLLGFLSLLVTPFQAAVYFGLLVSSAILLGMFGDLLFMQSMILTFSPLRSFIRRIIEKEAAKEVNTGQA